MASLSFARAFAPATVGNAGCGFDVLGFALEAPGDTVTVRASGEPGVRMGELVTPTGTVLPLETERNVAGLVVSRMAKAARDRGADVPPGLIVDLDKGLGVGTGMGSSAASAAAAAIAASALLGDPFDEVDLFAFGLAGEALASGSRHGDNLAPALFGGFAGVRSLDPPDWFVLPVPPELHCVLIHPRVEVLTADARKAMPDSLPLADGIAQWADVASLVAGLYGNDYDRIGRSLTDRIAEPHRARFIPGFGLLRESAAHAGALGSGISGSGPSVFALTRGAEAAGRVASAWREAYAGVGPDFAVHVSRVARRGARLLESG